MSILEIGYRSRFHQATPGNREHLTPFKSLDERREIMEYKENKQHEYRDILLQQIKQNQLQKLKEKQEIKDQQLKHERQFYEKLRRAQQAEEQRVKSSRRKSNDKVSLPSISSPQQKSKFSNSNHLISGINNSFSWGENKFSNSFGANHHSNNYLSSRDSLNLSENHSSHSTKSYHLKSSRFKWQNEPIVAFDTLQQTSRRYKDLKDHLEQKNTEVLQMIKKSSALGGNSNNRVKQITKRLKTEPMNYYNRIEEESEIGELIGDDPLWKQPNMMHMRKLALKPLKLYNHLQSDEGFYHIPRPSQRLLLNVSQKRKELFAKLRQANPQQQKFDRAFKEQEPTEQEDEQNSRHHQQEPSASLVENSSSVQEENLSQSIIRE